MNRSLYWTYIANNCTDYVIFYRHIDIVVFCLLIAIAIQLHVALISLAIIIFKGNCSQKFLYSPFIIFQ